MAVRSKYSELPGIDNQPDVYETPDVVEKLAEQNGDSSTQNGDENIHVLKIDAKEAFEKFSGKYLDPGDADFSGRCGPRQMQGYATKTEFEMLGDGVAKETPQNKFNRLQHEIRELAEELEQIKPQHLSIVKYFVNYVHLLDPEFFSSHYSQICYCCLKQALTVASTPQAGLSQRLQTQLEAFKTTETVGGKEAKSDDGCVTYELFYKPEHAKFNQLSKISEMEQRVQKLETVLGSDPTHLVDNKLFLCFFISLLMHYIVLLWKTSLNGSWPHRVIKGTGLKSGFITSSWSYLLKHIQPGYCPFEACSLLYFILQGILHHVSVLSEKKEEAENAAKQSKVTELYELLNKWDSFVDVVPDLVCTASSCQEMGTVQDEHEEKKLSPVVLSQEAAASALEAKVAMLDANHIEHIDARFESFFFSFQLEASFTSNVAVIEANCERVEARVNALLEKFETKGR
ncbi:dynactin subunit 2-like [Orbicella faveolata]|uniref:dynactin subunit 2-like n=1 Tax=Orbicella faveolata TaxID=48498 RepID=UPI0009E41D98|nr:dynactin subunit 2-like [Orbicella faveolata]